MKHNLREAAKESLDDFAAAVAQELSAVTALAAQLSHKVDALQSLIEMSGLVDQAIVDQRSEEIWPSECRLDVNSLPPEMSNLYKCELSATKVPYRWTGPNKSTSFSFKIDRALDRTVEFRFLAAVSPDVLKKVTVYVDGYEALSSVTKSAITAKLPASLNVRKSTEIVLIVADVFSPKTISDSADIRMLGIALTSISIQ